MKSKFSEYGRHPAVAGEVPGIPRRPMEERSGAIPERFRRCFDLGLVGMAISSPARGMLEVNDYLCQILGYARSELLKMSWAELTHPDDLAADNLNFDHVLAGMSNGYTMDKRFVRKDGKLIDSTISVKCLRLADGSIDYFVGMLQDITGRKREEEKLRAAHEQLARLLAHSPAVLYTLRIEGGKVIPMFVSSNIERLLGFTTLECLNCDWWMERLHPEDLGRAVTTLAGGLTQQGYSMEYRVQHKDGSYRWVEDHSRVIRDACGEPTEMMGVWTDVTERKRSEEARIMQGLVLESMAEGVTVCNEMGVIQFSNAASDAMFGYKGFEMADKRTSIAQKAPCEESQRFVDRLIGHLNGRSFWGGELHSVKRDGSTFITRSRVSVLEIAGSKSVVAVFADVTEEMTRQVHSLRSQRMESLGKLSSGIAHDLNNILTPILMSVSMLRRPLPDDEFEKTLHAIETSAQRGAEFISQLLAFGRGSGGQRVVVQPNSIIREVMEMMRGTFPKDIVLASETAGQCWPVTGDATQLHQVLLNLCVNARDVMPQGGTLSLSTRNVRLDENDAVMNAGASAGPYVMLCVSDTGKGIPPEMIDKIFDPFFTTKEAGKGTGLGLSTVMRIVKSHKGFVKIRSQVGTGSTFEVCLPALPDAAETTATVPTPAAPPRGRGETILVVDDEPVIRDVVQKILQFHGYKVVSAGNGTEAIALYGRLGNEIKAVLTDIRMPVMDGVTMARALKEMDPSIKIIASSGMDKNDRMAELDFLGVNKFVSKPYSARDILRAIGELLSEEQTVA